MSLGQKSIKSFFKIIILLIQFLLKLQAVRPTQLDLNIDTLQVVFGTEQKKIHIQMLNRNIYKLEKLETLKKNSKRQTHSNGGRVGRASFCLEKKYNGFQQVRILFEKIMQIQKLINGSSNKKEVKLEEEKVNFLEVMKKILSFIQSSSLNREAIETWNYAISEVLKNQYHLKEDMLIEEMTKLAESLVASKTQKIKIYWDNLVTSKNLRTQSQDEEQELFDCFDSEEEKELSVSGKIVDHMLVTKPGNPTFLWQ